MEVLAIDIGASAGKAFVASLEDESLRLDEVHRFPNGPREQGGRLVWDTDALFEEVRVSAQQAKRKGHAPASLGIDSWAVDFALIDERGERVRPVYCYRDAAWPAAMDAFHERLAFPEMFAIAGIQQLPFNTVYQLATRHDDEQERAAQARAAQMVMIPEYLMGRVAGRVAGPFAGRVAGRVAGRFVAEASNASTTSLLDARTRRWSDTIATAAGATPLLPDVVAEGTSLAHDVSFEGLRLDVRLPACHDTASAVAATPLESPNAAYISSGTWSLVGVELGEPLLTPEAERAGFTNEAGLRGTTRFLKNVMGLWLLQECRREWALRGPEGGLEVDAGDPLSFGAIARAVDACTERVPLLFPDDPCFLAPPSMLQAIASFCRRTGQAPPVGVGQTAKCIKLSLALRYRQVLESLERLTGRHIETVNVVGGGARDQQLCRLTADVSGRRVVAGPVEATALGNAVVQLMGMGAIRDLATARRLVARSTDARVFEPAAGSTWNGTYEHFLDLRH